MWSGRFPHRVRHVFRGRAVAGAWTNNEGLAPHYRDRLDQVLARSTDYRVFLNGKLDWTAGDHTENVDVAAWTMYLRRCRR